jgi:hypothetical protein
MTTLLLWLLWTAYVRIHSFFEIRNIRLCFSHSSDGHARLPLGSLQVIPVQGCQMIYFQTNNYNLGKFWRALQWKMLVYFMDIWSILLYIIWYTLWQFGIFYGYWFYIIPVLVCCNQEKSGNPVPVHLSNVYFRLSRLS